jgi:hypothetical protein
MSFPTILFVVILLVLRIAVFVCPTLNKAGIDRQSSNRKQTKLGRFTSFTCLTLKGFVFEFKSDLCTSSSQRKLPRGLSREKISMRY